MYYSKPFDYEQDVLYFAEEDMRNDLSEYLEHFNAESLKDIDRNDLKEFLSERLLTDGVFGIGDELGEPIPEAVSAIYINGNEELTAKALRASGKDVLLGSDEVKELSPVLLEHEMIRYEIDRLADRVIDNVLNDIHSERSELNDHIRSEFMFVGEDILDDYYRETVQSDIKEYLENNINDILDEISISDRYSYEHSNELETYLSEALMNGDISLTERNSIGVTKNLEEILGNECFRDSGYTVADYFENKDVSDYVEHTYAVNVALEELKEAIKNSKEEIIFPALEQREEENGIDLAELKLTDVTFDEKGFMTAVVENTDELFGKEAKVTEATLRESSSGFVSDRFTFKISSELEKEPIYLDLDKANLKNVFKAVEQELNRNERPEIDFSENLNIKAYLNEDDYFVEDRLGFYLSLSETESLWNRTGSTESFAEIATDFSQWKIFYDDVDGLTINFRDFDKENKIVSVPVTDSEREILSEELKGRIQNFDELSYDKPFREREKPMELNFTNKIDEHQEVIDEGKINAILVLDDYEYEELYRRGNFEEKTGLPFDKMMNETDMYMNAYAVEEDGEMKLYVTCDYYADAYIDLSENERESLIADVGRAIEERGEQEYLKEEDDIDLD